MFFFFFSSRRRHTRWNCDWSSDVCSSDLEPERDVGLVLGNGAAYLAADYSQIFIVHALEVAPLSKVALVHFVVQLGESAGGLTVADVPANTDAVCGQIVNDFPQDQYWQDLEPGVMQIIRNF